MKYLLAILVCILAFVSCQKRVLYSQYIPVPVEGWMRNDTLCYEADMLYSGGNCSMELGLRINNFYPYQNISIIVEWINGLVSKTDTIDQMLYDKEKNLSEGGIGLYQYVFPFGGLSVNAGDTIILRVHHNMRKEILLGISDVGIQINRY